jgi:predicted acylesterase/phospholipase RssA
MTNLVTAPNEFEAWPFDSVVLEGGGMKGLAHLGALEQLNKVWRRAAGSSVGSLFALLLHSGFGFAEARDLVEKTDFGTFMDPDLRAASFWTHWLPELPGAQYSRLLRYGAMYSANALEKWVMDALCIKFGSGASAWTLQQLFEHVNSFSAFSSSSSISSPDLLTQDETGRLTSAIEAEVAQLQRFLDPDCAVKELAMIVTDADTHRARLVFHETFPDMPVSKAVRLSCSLPGFFEEDVPCCGLRGLDGGLMDNFPIELWDLIDHRRRDRLSFLLKQLASISAFSCSSSSASSSPALLSFTWADYVRGRQEYLHSLSLYERDECEFLLHALGDDDDYNTNTTSSTAAASSSSSSSSKQLSQKKKLQKNAFSKQSRTLGLRLKTLSTATWSGRLASSAAGKTAKSNWPVVQLVSTLIDILMHNQEHHAVVEALRDHVLTIRDIPFDTTQFKMSLDQKRQLFELGRRYARVYEERRQPSSSSSSSSSSHNPLFSAAAAAAPAVVEVAITEASSVVADSSLFDADALHELQQQKHSESALVKTDQPQNDLD